MPEISLVFPHQLFKPDPQWLHRRVALIEDELYFRQYAFHKKKLILHRASMKAYEQQLLEAGYQCDYFNASEVRSLEAVFQRLSKKGITRVRYADVEDYLLERRIVRLAGRYGIQIEKKNSPNFLCEPQPLPGSRYNLTSFYIAMRKKTGIMLEEGQPSGGKWTFDTENRKRLPATVQPPLAPETNKSPFVQEATEYVRKHFPDNYGVAEQFQFPIDRASSRSQYRKFLDQRFYLYGHYQDAIHINNSWLFHSLLTPTLNIGLIDPGDVLDMAQAAAARHKVPINSLEGFVRQVLGWREFIRLVYRQDGVKQRTLNFFSHRNPVPSKFYNASTGIDPVDNVIAKVLKTGYCNHIERLMILGNFMLLCEMDPDEVYRWFMELFIDSYDWVMVPNVYGMSQYADSGMMSTKPYISGSNYVLKMSNFRKGPWCDIWDALYWCFIEKHKDILQANPRMTLITKLADKIDRAKMKRMQQVKDTFLASLY